MPSERRDITATVEDVVNGQRSHQCGVRIANSKLTHNDKCRKCGVKGTNCVFQNREDEVSYSSEDKMSPVLKLSREPAVQTQWSFFAALPPRPELIIKHTLTPSGHCVLGSTDVNLRNRLDDLGKRCHFPHLRQR